MKKVFVVVGLIITMIFNSSITCYASTTEDNVVYVGEAARDQYYKKYLYDVYSVDNVDDLTNKEDKVKFLLDKLAIEYMILSDTICWTDNYVFINGDCALTIWIQNYPYMALTDEDIDKKLEYINDVVNTYNTDDTWDHFNMKYNMWWYSLGENYKSYIHIYNNINKLTTKLNILLDDDKKVDSLDKMYSIYSYDEIKEKYDQHTKLWKEYYDLPVYPQGNYNEINWEYLNRSDN